MAAPLEWPMPDLLARQAPATPDRPALVAAASGRSWSYGELSAGPVAELAGGLTAAGLAPGDHLGVLAEPGVGLAQLVHAAARAGVVFVPLSPDAPPAAVRQRCVAADVDRLVTIGSTSETVAAAFDGPVLDFSDLEGRAMEPPAHEWARDGLQWLVFTSGTTGDPRPVELTAGNLLASATASGHRLGAEPNDRWLACLPMHHVGGLAPLVRSALEGTTAVVQAGFDIDTTMDAMANCAVTGVSLVPTMLRRLLDAGWEPPDSLRFVLLGGAPARPELVDRCAAAGVPVCPTYGATETASQIATATAEEAFEHRGTVGRPLRGTAVAVVDDGEPVATGAAGELVVSGPTVSPGYYGDATATADRFADGTFHTGDRGYRDDAGRLWVIGRLDSVITTGGETVHPDTVEAALRSHPDVADAAAVGLEDDEWGEIVAALVTGSPRRHVDADALGEHCRDRLEPAAVPKLFELTDALPRTASGTVDRSVARERLREARRRGGL